MPISDLVLFDLPVPITTPRLVLRPPQAGDGEQVHQAILDGYDDKIKWLSWSKTPPTVEEVERESRIQSANWIMREDLRFVCIRRDTDQIIGRLGFPAYQCLWQIPLISISYFIAGSQQNQGYGTEAVNALTRYAFDHIGARKVSIQCDTDKVASYLVPEKLNFAVEAKQKGTCPRPDKKELAEGATYSLFSKDPLPPLQFSW